MSVPVKENMSKLALSVSLFKSFFYIGIVTVGGGLVMLPLIEREFVNKKKWLTKEQMMDVFALSQSAPGVIAINTSLLTGFRLAGLWGAILASIGMMLPSFVIIIAITPIFYKIQSLETVTKAFTGMRIAITVMLLFTVFGMAKSVIRDAFTLVIFILALIVSIFFNINLAYVILASGIIGILSYPVKNYLMKRKD